MHSSHITPSNTVSIIRIAPSSARSGQSFDVGWSISGATSVTHTNALSLHDALPISSYDSTSVQSGGSGSYSATITAPSVNSPTRYYWEAHATVGGTEYYSTSTH